jgi:hypothetical protein
LGAYEASLGKPLYFTHAADDREAVQQSTERLMEEINRLIERSARRLLDASWRLRSSGQEAAGEGEQPK